MYLPPRITIREVAPRDGLQSEPKHLTAAEKSDLIDRISAAGFPRVNAASFVSPKAVPQMADSAEVMASIHRVPGVSYDASVPNMRGLERALEADVDAVVVFVATSEVGSMRNQKCTVDEAMDQAQAVIRAAAAAGKRTVGTVAMSFGSPYGEEITPAHVRRLVDRYLEAGVDAVALGDTTGVATPLQTARLCGTLLETLGDIELSLHLHDTRGLALANVLAAMDAGVTNFDSAIGGIGGSPFTRNSSGNVSTEDLVGMCHAMGVETGVDLDAVLEIYGHIEQLLEHPLPGRLGAFRGDAA